jgi:hypothetical protein
MSSDIFLASTFECYAVLWTLGVYDPMFFGPIV